MNYLKHFNKLIIAHGERSEPCAYQTLTHSPSAEGSCYLPRVLMWHGRRVARSQTLTLFNSGRHKLRNFCARLNHFLGVYGKNEDYHPLCFFVLFIVVYFVFSVNAFFHGENCETKSPFSAFFKKAKKRQFCFAIFSMKNASTEKTKYTTTKSTKKRRRW